MIWRITIKTREHLLTHRVNLLQRNTPETVYCAVSMTQISELYEKPGKNMILLSIDLN